MEDINTQYSSLAYDFSFMLFCNALISNREYQTKTLLFKEEGFIPYGYVTWLYTWACYLQTVYLVQRSPVSPAHCVTAGKGVIQ